MFIHNFKYTFITLFKNKMLIFWTFAFPIILGTFFNMAFSNIENNEKLDIINIAIIENEEFKENEIFKEAFKTLSDENNEDRLFNLKIVTEENAKELLENDEIVGYMILENKNPKITVKTSGINETIFKYVTEEIQGQSEIIQNISQNEIKKEIANGNYNIDYEKISKNVLEMTNNQEVKIKNISNSNLSYTMIEFYTLIAMACLYGGILGMVAINQNLPNMGSIGKRVASTPTSKVKLILSSVLASYITQLIGLAILFVYTIFVLKVDYGDNLLMVILLALCGALAGLSLGIAVGSALKTNDNMKTGIVISITMLRLLFIWNDGNYDEIYCR